MLRHHRQLLQPRPLPRLAAVAPVADVINSETRYAWSDHWLKAGGPTEWIISDWMVSRCVAIGDLEGKVQHIAQARRELASEESQEDRQLIESQIATV